jgi:hypothetical protein
MRDRIINYQTCHVTIDISNYRVACPLWHKVKFPRMLQLKFPSQQEILFPLPPNDGYGTCTQCNNGANGSWNVHCL